MKAERTVGLALQVLEEQYLIPRDQLFVASKIGYIPEDADRGITGEKYVENLINNKIITNEDIVGEVHCMTPGYLNHQIDESLKNLNCETLDLMYLHNSVEQQMPIIGEQNYYEKLAKAFEVFEKAVQDNKIRSYGLASWICFRSPMDEEDIHASVMRIHEIATKVAGENHNFKYIQAPINLMMVEAMAEKWQPVDSELHYKDRYEALEKQGAGMLKKMMLGKPTPGGTQFESLLRVLRIYKINLMVSSPLLQGMMLNTNLDDLHCENNSARHINF